jgi:amino acid transporter
MTQQSQSNTASTPAGTGPVRLHRALGLWHLIIIGMVIVQPTAPMGIYGVISNKGHGHVVTCIFIAMIAMLFTAIGYGRMARIYPSAGSAYTYVGQEIHSGLGYVVGWSTMLAYLLNPLICTAFCAKAAMNILPGILNMIPGLANISPGLSFYFWILFFAGFFTWTNLRGIKTSAKMDEALCIGMTIVVVLFLACVIRTVCGVHYDPNFFTLPFYDPAYFKPSYLYAGTSIAVLSYIGFDAVSTLSEEVENPRRNIMLATVLLCLIAGLMSGLEVYAAQLIWGSKPFPSNVVESAFAMVSRLAGGVVLFQIINFTLLVANMGSGMGSQLAAGRLLYGMGRGNALPKSFFGVIARKHRIPRNNILLIGAIAVAGSGLMELFSAKLGGGAYEIGAQCLVFGTLVAFMGVNASSFVHLCRHRESKGMISLLVSLIIPLLGFIICAILWGSVSYASMVMGGLWLVIGIAYGFVRTKGFRAELVNFDIPPDVD